ncbi:hypothetical protein AB0M87_32070 [Streptomyces sp. NPDC051320]|uniref:hypothetical protein n=1 Tax=Streptomyces sp. NPDC051320 TaxID=3154644 RepID=UPI00341CA991
MLRSGIPSPDVLPGLDATDPVDLVINWGRGVDSTTYLTRMLDDPAAHGVDLRRTAVITMATGDEWPRTDSDAEEHVLPLLRRHHVRLVQLARAGQAKHTGIDVLDDSRNPQRMIRRGRWALWHEMETNGTVPQQGGSRLCSIRAKGEVGDRWIPGATGGRPFRQVIGFNADEVGRAMADRAASSNPLRTASFPLIDWSWGRKRCEDYLQERFGVRWQKSYCTFCCYPVSMGALPQHLDRMRAHPDIAGRVLRLEYTSMCLNPHGKLFGRRSLLEQFDERRGQDRAMLDAFTAELLTCDWTTYLARRILPVSTANPPVRAPALRSVRRLHTGGRAALGRSLQRVAERRNLRVESDSLYGAVRDWVFGRGESLPTAEEFFVTAPGFVKDKQQDRFEAAWTAHTGLRALTLPGT